MIKIMAYPTKESISKPPNKHSMKPIP